MHLIDLKILDLKILDARLITGPYLPNYGSPGAAGCDLRACINEDLLLHPGEQVMVDTGIAIHIADPGLCAVAMPRSGLGSKGLVLGNTLGLIDSDYQGPLKLCLWNRGQNKITVQPLDRVAQLVIMPVMQVQFNVVENFARDTVRGAGGFGSTGVRG
jgi:dUTP pyrophosphatase